MSWAIDFALFLVFLALTLATLTVILGKVFLAEFTRPGETIKPGMPEWECLQFPTPAFEVPLSRRRTVSFRASDGTPLQGQFWAQPRQAPTLVISHGYHVPSDLLHPVATLAYEQGTNILLFDFRGHGKSSQVPTTCGISEVADLLAALDVAAGQQETLCDRVYVLGFSMGASVALSLPPQVAVAGVVADSPYARLDYVILSTIKETLRQQTLSWSAPIQAIAHRCFPALACLILLGGRLLFRLRHHRSLIARPDQTIGAHTAPVLLIHAMGDPFTAVSHAHTLSEAARRAGRSIQTHLTGCAIHCGSYGHDPAAYLALLKAFVV